MVDNFSAVCGFAHPIAGASYPNLLPDSDWAPSFFQKELDKRNLFFARL
jgi:hypothetical protein